MTNAPRSTVICGEGGKPELNPKGSSPPEREMGEPLLVQDSPIFLCARADLN